MAVAIIGGPLKGFGVPLGLIEGRFQIDMIRGTTYVAAVSVNWGGPFPCTKNPTIWGPVQGS